jgi:hypothetical protein
MADVERFKSILRSHVGIIERAVRDYDEGHEDASLSISNSLRAIFHDKGRTVSVLSRLSLKNTPMLTTGRGHGDWKDYLAHVIDITSSRPVVMKPVLGDPVACEPLDVWWDSEPIFVDKGIKYTRRRIVLSMAEKGGGTHADEDLEPFYEVLSSGRYGFGIIGDLTYDGPPPFPQGVTIYSDNAHFALVRQFAHEVLASAHDFNWLP